MARSDWSPVPSAQQVTLTWILTRLVNSDQLPLPSLPTTADTDLSHTLSVLVDTFRQTLIHSLSHTTL